MGRAPNSGAPQRVSAHVVPKAQAFATEDEDDKTTIEAGWEEEASTTVEQGDVADKIRALALGAEPKRRSNTSITSTNGGVSDEPTVDDQRASAALAQLPPPQLARLIITSGNDAGQALEIRPGKTYTVGRGIDNDLVLTDIAVSRKHFDLRHEHGAWVLADRGSGNGTLINARIEDAPFMLASGDTIEIGNTAFRFELPGGVPRAHPVFRTGEISEVDDDLEMSTVSGKPYREVEPQTPPDTAPVPPLLTPPLPAPALPAAARPKTLPPPAPLPRPRTQTGRPAMSFDRGTLSQQMAIPTAPTQPPIALALGPALGPAIVAMPGPHALHGVPLSTTLPLPQLPNRPPISAMQPSGLLDPLAGPLPATIPGQGAPAPMRPARLPFSTYSSEIPTQRGPSSSRPPMMIASGQPGRDATSTALVPPISYGNGAPALVAPPAYAHPPPISRRMKMILGGAAIAMFAAVATIAAIKGSTGPGAAKATDAGAPTRARPTVEPIEAKPATPPKPASRTLTVTPIPTAAPPATTRVAPPVTVPPSAPVAHPPDRAVTAPAVVPPAPAVTAPPAVPPPAPPPRAQVAIVTPIAPPEPRVEAPRKAEVHVDPPKVDKKPAKPPDKKPERRPARVAEPAHVEAEHGDKPEVVAATAPHADKKHAGRSTQDVKNDANNLYRAKNFAAAAQLITAALSGFSGDDAQELRSMAAIYSQLGKAYNIGMAPGTKPTDAYQALRRAASYDRDVGSAYLADIQAHQVVTAARAAVSYMASKEYEAAFQAVRTSESLGSTSSSNTAVRDRLEQIAGELLRSAQGDMQTDPDGGKKKAHQVLGMVDPKNALYGKAQKLLNGP